MMKLNTELMYRARFQKLYMLYDMGQIGWNAYIERLKRLNSKYRGKI